MLTKISSVKNLGVFADFGWDNGLRSFKRYNVIYGDNGSGKTTLSRLLGCLNEGAHPDYANLEYRIESDAGEWLTGTQCPTRIRVFNADYLQSNIGQLDGSLKPILVIGEENKALADTLIADQAELEARKLDIAAAEKRRSGAHDVRGKIFSDIAKTISEALVGSSVRNYRKQNSEQAFDALTDPKSLSEDELNIHRLTLRQEQMATVVLPPIGKFLIGGIYLRSADAMRALGTKTHDLCMRSATSTVIQRLLEHADLTAWVEHGLNLHRTHDSIGCEFCGQQIPEERLAQLANHFSQEDQDLKGEIELLLKDIRGFQDAVAAIQFPSSTAIFSELRPSFEGATGVWSEVVSSYGTVLQSMEEQVLKKLEARSIVKEYMPGGDFPPLEDIFQAIAGDISKHNTKVSAFEAAKESARRAIEAHYLVSIKERVDEQSAKEAAEDAIIAALTNGDEASGSRGIGQLESTIVDTRAKISNAHRGGEILTKNLQTFLGRKELVFYSDDDGYRIQREGKPAKRLSEGERTAIAFLYFIGQLKDSEFNLAEGIVVIDDPVSSLDSSSLYQAFGFLKTAVCDAKQVFFLTHNFTFLRLVLNWLCRGQPKSRPKHAEFYMLVCRTTDKGRITNLLTLDKTLVEHPTEYQFLFKILMTFKGDGTIEQCYHIPNVARKVLETFLDFYVPHKESPYLQLEEVDFDQQKKTSILKFTNDLSHFTGQGFEPALSAESQKNVGALLEMIEVVMPQHYKGMIEAIS